jgi:hypothetical protein
MLRESELEKRLSGRTSGHRKKIEKRYQRYVNYVKEQKREYCLTLIGGALMTGITTTIGAVFGKYGAGIGFFTGLFISSEALDNLENDYDDPCDMGGTI